MQDSKRQSRILILQFMMIIAGILVGLSNFVILHQIALFISDIFIKIFRAISLPIIALSIIVTMSKLHTDAIMPKLWKKTIFYTFASTIIAASMSCVLYLIIKPSNIIVNTMLDNKTIDNSNTYFQYLKAIIPNNVFAPFIEYNVIGVLLLGITIGLAINFIPDDNAKKTINNFFNGLHMILIIVTGWIIRLLPVGIFGFIATLIVQLKSGVNVNGLGQYLMIVILSNLVQGFIVLPIWLKFNQISPIKMMRAMYPALSLAFFSKSSAGTLPVTINVASTRANIKPKVSQFVLPFCTTINMNGCAAFIFTTVIYVMQNYHVHIDLFTMLAWIIIATIAAIGNAGVPMGCFFLSMSLLSSMNIPVNLMGIILPFYTVIDMVETALNVWSDSCVAKVIDKKVT